MVALNEPAAYLIILVQEVKPAHLAEQLPVLLNKSIFRGLYCRLISFSRPVLSLKLSAFWKFTFFTIVFI